MVRASIGMKRDHLDIINRNSIVKNINRSILIARILLSIQIEITRNTTVRILIGTQRDISQENPCKPNPNETITYAVLIPADGWDFTTSHAPKNGEYGLSRPMVDLYRSVPGSSGAHDANLIG
jgi:hypothetical protein